MTQRNFRSILSLSFVTTFILSPSSRSNVIKQMQSGIGPTSSKVRVVRPASSTIAVSILTDDVAAGGSDTTRSDTSKYGQHRKEAIITGKVLEDKTFDPIPGATVVARRIADSVIAGGVVSDSQGIFEMQKLRYPDSLWVEVRHVAFQSYRIIVYLKERRLVMAPVTLVEALIEFPAVEVMGRRPPMVVRGDTVEYNVEAFSARPNSWVGDVLHKLPGLAIDANGNLTYNGQKISQILVNGMEFFGADGADALRTIPKDVVDKIQLTDSDRNSLSLLRNEKEKTLNIQLKKDVTVFGDAGAGAGGSFKNQYETRGNMNYLQAGHHLALRAALNNTALGNSLSRFLSTGVSYGTKVGKKTGITSAYSYRFPLNENETVRKRTEFLTTDSALHMNSVLVSRRSSGQHQVNLSFTDSDSLSSLGISLPNVQYDVTQAQTTSYESTISQSNSPINTVQKDYSSDGERFSIPLHINWRKAFLETKANLSLHLSSSNTRQKNREINLAIAGFHVNGVDSVTQLRQEITGDNRSDNYNFSFEYSQYVVENLTALLRNETSYNHISNERETWKLDANDARLERDSLFSSLFRSRTFTDRGTFSLHYNRSGIQASGRILLEYSKLNQFDQTRKRDTRRDFLTMVPALSMNLELDGTSNVYLNYSFSKTNPTVDQLEPVPDNSNPLFTRTGNPNLKPVIRHSLGVNYQSRSQDNMSTLYASAHISEANEIVSTVTYDGFGRQVSSYANVDGITGLGASVRFMGIKKPEDATLSVGAMADGRYNEGKSYINGVLSQSNQWGINPSVHVDYNLRDLFSVNVNYSPSYSAIIYDHASSTNQEFTVHNVTGGVTVFLIESLAWANHLSFVHNNSLPPDFGRSSIVWNSELTFYFLSEKKGVLNVRARDLLNKRRDTRRIVGQYFIEDIQTNEQRQYFMLSFSYHFR